jgi:hypothetical protein
MPNNADQRKNSTILRALVNHLNQQHEKNLPFTIGKT